MYGLGNHLEWKTRAPSANAYRCHECATSCSAYVRTVKYRITVLHCTACIMQANSRTLYSMAGLSFCIAILNALSWTLYEESAHLPAKCLCRFLSCNLTPNLECTNVREAFGDDQRASSGSSITSLSHYQHSSPLLFSRRYRIYHSLAK